LPPVEVDDANKKIQIQVIKTLSDGTQTTEMIEKTQKEFDEMKMRNENKKKEKNGRRIESSK